MKTIWLVTALLLVPSLATEADAHNDNHRAYVGAAGTSGDRMQRHEIERRHIAAPPWSFACTNDTGQQQCDEPMWVYGSPDYVAQFKNAF